MPKTSPQGFIRNARLSPALLSLAFLAAVLLPSVASAAPRLRCQLSQSGTIQVLDFTPVADPYRVKSVDLQENFRFKAVVVGDAQKISYIKLYTYYYLKRQPVLLHQATYLAPAVQTDTRPDVLTGTITLYSPHMEREFQYGCALLEVTP